MTPATEELPGSAFRGAPQSPRAPSGPPSEGAFSVWSYCYGHSDRALFLANHRFCNSQLSTEPEATSNAPNQNGSDKLRCNSSALAPTDSTGVA